MRRFPCRLISRSDSILGRTLLSPMPQSPSAHSKASSDDCSNRLSEAALRKKKNADAQAAFRARRANYIATLEETVTNLESVVLQLQDTYKQTKNENAELRSENAQLRHAMKQRDRALRRIYQGRPAPNTVSPTDEFPPAPPYSAHAPSAMVQGAMPAAHVAQYADNVMRYQTGPDSNVSMAGPFHPDYPQRSPAMAFASGIDTSTPPDSHAQPMDPHRMPRYDQYGYPMDDCNREGTWVTDDQGGPSPSDVLDSSSSSHSPNFVESPTLTTSDLAYPQYPLDDQKVNLASLNSAPYMYPSSRSISPTISTPTSTSSTSLAPSPFPFTFPEASMIQERPEFGYRRPQPAPQLTLHGGTADISIAASSRGAARYRTTRSDPLTQPPMAQALSTYSRLDNSSGGRDSDDSEAASYTYSNRSRPRSDIASARPSRSPSPGPPPICGTLAVIKAQAFGALRRTRARSRKTSEGAAKAAVEALEARGIGMGIGTTSKRPRLLVDDDELQT